MASISLENECFYQTFCATSSNILIHVPKLKSAEIPCHCYACLHLPVKILPSQDNAISSAPGHCPLGSRPTTSSEFLHSGCTRYMFTGYLPDWCKLNTLPGATRICVVPQTKVTPIEESWFLSFMWSTKPAKRNQINALCETVSFWDWFSTTLYRK